MYKIMIVDDEPVIRFGLKASIPLENGRYEVAGAFSNGKEALDHFSIQYPDILITDIKMPIMDGLELARQALQIHPHLKIIFVSSYSDFEYVREGLKLGAVDYLLKPTLEPEDLIELIEKCTRLIEHEQKVKQELTEHREAQKGLHRKELQQELKMMLASQDFEIKQQLWKEWFKKGYTLFYGVMTHRKELEERNGYLFPNIKVEEMIDCYYRQFQEGVIISLNNSDFVIASPCSEEDVKVIIQTIKEKLETEIGVSLAFGFQNEKDLNHFRRCFWQAKEAVEHRFYDETIDIYPYQSKFGTYKDNHTLHVALKDAVNESDQNQIETIIERWVKGWESATLLPDQVRREAGDLISTLFQRKVEIPVLLQKMDEFAQAETLEELKAILDKTIFQWNDKHPISFDSPTTHQQLMERALDYIQQNYTSDLTLQKIADYSFISKNYFSLLFKKYMDQNFIDYVISLRIKKAEQLLTDTAYKVYEVAQKSGFNDVKYFSKLFKKLTGLSPGEYREKVRTIAE